MSAPRQAYTLRQICEILEIDEGFAALLVQESILCADCEGEAYSASMLERARVARELVQELDVNLPGASVIVRLREELAELRHAARELARELVRARR